MKGSCAAASFHERLGQWDSSWLPSMFIILAHPKNNEWPQACCKPRDQEVVDLEKWRAIQIITSHSYDENQSFSRFPSWHSSTRAIALRPLCTRVWCLSLKQHTRKASMDMEEHWPLYFKTLFEMILQVIMIDHGYTFDGSKKFSFFSFS